MAIRGGEFEQIRLDCCYVDGKLALSLIPNQNICLTSNREPGRFTWLICS